MKLRLKISNILQKSLKGSFILGFALLGLSSLSAQQAADIDYNKLSEQFLQQAREGKSTEAQQHLLETVTLKELSTALDTDDKRYAFWVNIYNGFIQVILAEHPELYEDRNSFFKRRRLKIAGRIISFADIEHGILRRSRWDLGLGFIPTIFNGKYERKLRVKDRDYRIHFALNCGAKDCPPVAIYRAEDIQAQFTAATTRFINNTTTYDASANVAHITPLFSWFRGDFKNKKKIKEILLTEGLIPNDSADLVSSHSQ